MRGTGKPAEGLDAKAPRPGFVGEHALQTREQLDETALDHAILAWSCVPSNISSRYITRDGLAQLTNVRDTGGACVHRADCLELST